MLILYIVICLLSLGIKQATGYYNSQNPRLRTQDCIEFTSKTQDFIECTGKTEK